MKKRELIKIQSPYDNIFDYGYLIIKDEKTFIALKEIGSNRYSKNMSYARYLMSVHLNRFLNDDEKVVRIDNNLGNDIENLKIVTINKQIKPKKQIVTINKNIPKEQPKLFKACCSNCGKIYLRKTKIVSEHKPNFCSVQCQHQNNKKSARYYNTMLVTHNRFTQ